jgi:voltage-gated potassium channel
MVIHEQNNESGLGERSSFFPGDLFRKKVAPYHTLLVPEQRARASPLDAEIYSLRTLSPPNSPMTNIDPRPTNDQAVLGRRAKWRDELYVIIFEADTRAGQLFDIALLIAIILSITVVSLETVQEVKEAWQSQLTAVECVLTLLFTAEYLARLLCVRKPLKYAFSFYGIIDLLACLPLYISFFSDISAEGSIGPKSLAIVRSIRLLRVFRVLKMMRMLREAHVLKEAIWQSRDKILVFLAFVLVVVTLSGTLMYQVEMGAPDNKFTSIPESMYWAIVTMTTVGYGDIVPHTPIGKFLSATLILLGYSLIIVPISVVSSELNIQNKNSLTARTCPHCFREGHSPDANYCDLCGDRLAS